MVRARAELRPRHAPNRLRVLLTLLLALSGSSCRDGDSSAEERGGTRPAPVVEVVTADPTPWLDEIELVGELRADESVVLQPEISGVIETVEFEEGQRVAAGDVLFRLRDGEQRARLREAEARRALAQDEFERTRRLASQNAAAAAQLDRARSELEIARAQVELARVELARTRIRAPFPGMVGPRLVSPGAHVTPDSELVRVDALDRLELAFTVPERAIPVAQIDARVHFTVAPFPDERFEGRLSFIDPSVNPATRRLLLKAVVENEEHRLLPGLFARVRLEVGEREALTVPAEAVERDVEGAYLWILDGESRASRVPVELGASRAGRVEIRSGLRAGDRVVAAGTHKLHPGVRVEPVPRAASEPRAGAAGGEDG